jgi:protein-S-isoprenylcysteine O-methyltransferase Ste14
MSTARVFDWLQLAALACLGCLGIGRALALYARGVRVLVADRQRSLAEMARDLLLVICLLLWVYETVASAWPLPVHAVPWLDVVLVDAVAVKAAGAAMLAAAIALYGLAVLAMGDAWRMGIDRRTPGALVTGGVFAWTRNPIYLSLELFVFGTFLVLGRLSFLAIASVMAVLLHDQIRREERFLAQAYGEPYRAYCARVGRYATWPFGRRGPRRR